VLHDVLRAVAHGERPPASAMAALDALLPRALARLRVVEAGAAGADGGVSFRWGWDEGAVPGDAAGLLAPVLWSAATLLTGPDRAHIRECAGERCGWLYVDRSRNRARRWCDMRTCGNREKARRHYARTKGRATER
jgi:predicted RNA-binding Zn ribbon-like protein